MNFMELSKILYSCATIYGRKILLFHYRLIKMVFVEKDQQLVSLYTISRSSPTCLMFEDKSIQLIRFFLA